jgi:hypothetical protein
MLWEKEQPSIKLQKPVTINSDGLWNPTGRHILSGFSIQAGHGKRPQ